MKVYKIKLMGADLYVKAVYFDTSGEELKLGIIPAFDEDEIAIYEEDKATKYVEMLNKQNEEAQFILEEK